MSDNNYKFYLRKDNLTYLYEKDGNVFETTIKTPLANSPMGWQDLAMRVNRNETTWGIFTKNAESLEFVLDGATILRSIYYTDSYEGKASLLIEQLNVTTRAYEFWGDGDIDFSGADDNDYRITVNVVPRGLYEIIENRKDTPYELSLDDPQALTCLIDGIKIRNIVSYTPITYKSQPFTSAGVNLVSLYRLSELGTSFMPNGVDGDIMPVLPFFTSPTNEIVNIKLRNLKLEYNYDCTLGIIKVSGAIQSNVWIHTASVNGNIISSVNLSIPMLVGDILRFIITPQQGGSGSPTAYGSIVDVSPLAKASVEVDAVLRFTPTNCKAFRYFHFAQKLINKITDGAYTLQSSFLSNPSLTSQARKSNWDNDPWNTLVTSGNGVRGIVGSTIKTTLTEMFKDCWSNWALGFGIEGDKVVIEPLTYFLNKNLKLATITAINYIRISTDVARISNQIKIGTGDYSYDELSGKDEFNTSITMLHENIKRVTKTDDCISPYRCDMYGIEKLRNYFNQQSTLAPQIVTVDNDSDNDTFLIEVAPVPVSGFYVPYRPVGATISGVDSPGSVYNVALDPKRRFCRHLPRIRSSAPITNKGNSLFQTTDKNQNLVSNLSGSGSAEDIVYKANVSLTTSTYLGRSVEMLWLPYIIKCTCLPTIELKQAIANNPYGYIEIIDKDKGRTLKGFMLDGTLKISIDSAGNLDSTELVLLSHPDNVFN